MYIPEVCDIATDIPKVCDIHNVPELCDIDIDIDIPEVCDIMMNLRDVTFILTYLWRATWY